MVERDKIVSSIIHKYHTDKLVNVNNLLITYLEMGNVFTFHFVGFENIGEIRVV
jgi:hypothetical protein